MCGPAHPLLPAATLTMGDVITKLRCLSSLTEKHCLCVSIGHILPCQYLLELAFQRFEIDFEGGGRGQKAQDVFTLCSPIGLPWPS